MGSSAPWRAQGSSGRLSPSSLEQVAQRSNECPIPTRTRGQQMGSEHLEELWVSLLNASSGTRQPSELHSSSACPPTARRKALFSPCTHQSHKFARSSPHSSSLHANTWLKKTQHSPFCLVKYTRIFLGSCSFQK